MSNSPVTKPWSSVCSLLDPEFGIAPDVTFQIVTTEGGRPEEVQAHRLILGFLSPVFRNQFFGFAKDTEDVISVKGTSKKAFESLIDFIYGKNIDWEALSLSDLFDVVNLAEMYILPEFMEEVKKQIDNYNLSDGNLIEAAAIAEEFNHFEEASAVLMTNCQNFLKAKIQTVQDASKFAAKNAFTEFESLALRLLASLESVEVECSNCGGIPCKDGVFVTDIETLKVGCLLKASAKCASRYRNKQCEVCDLDMGMKTFSVLWKKSGIRESIFSVGFDYWKYACKNG